MNTIHGIIHDLENEETVIGGGCTTPGEVISALIGLVEENDSLKRKLNRLEQARKEISDFNVNKAMVGTSEPFRIGVAIGLDTASEILYKSIENEG